MINNANDDYIDLDRYEPFQDVDLCADSDSVIDIDEMNEVLKMREWRSLPKYKKKETLNFAENGFVSDIADFIEMFEGWVLCVITAIWMLPIMIVVYAVSGVWIVFKSLRLALKRRAKK